MHNTDDVLAWLDTYWMELDPTPDTPENEALEVYRQRVSYLEAQFPDTPFGEWPTLWCTFFRHGLPDAEGAGPPRYSDTRAVTPARTSSGRMRQLRARRLRYESPRPFILIIEEGSTVPVALDRSPPRKAPSLEGVWEDLENPNASVWKKQRALLLLSWYELPRIAERLLSLPDELFAGAERERDTALRRLATRSSYLLETPEIRRLAALNAARSAPETLLERAISGHYTQEELRQDLDTISAMLGDEARLERMPDRGPHVELWRRPEELLEEIVRAFPSDDRITGWDWRGDVYLAYGPPAYMSTQFRTALYTWGTPEVLNISESMMGQVQARRVEDILRNFMKIASEEVEQRQKQGSSAALSLTGALGTGEEQRGGGPSRELMLRQLHVLAPPPVFQVGIPQGGSPLPLTMDAVAFPVGEDSIEVQASFGMPTDVVRIREIETGYTTELRTSFVLMDHDLNVVHATVRKMGYLIEGHPQIEDRFFLDTFRIRTVPGSYIAYLSAEDPEAGTSGGALQNLDFNWQGTSHIQVSPIMLATDIQVTDEVGKFVRGDLHILPAPSRHLLYGHDLYFYYEINNLRKSQFGDHVWEESYYVIPDYPQGGIVKMTTERDYTSLEPSVSRYKIIDLSNLETTYEGPIFLIVLITDKVAGEQAVGVTRFNLRRP